jgi:hypothetical protein
MWSLWVNPFHPAGGKWHPVRIMAPDPPAPPGELLVSRRGPRPALPSSITARTRSRHHLMYNGSLELTAPQHTAVKI